MKKLILLTLLSNLVGCGAIIAEIESEFDRVRAHAAGAAPVALCAGTTKTATLFA